MPSDNVFSKIVSIKKEEILLDHYSKIFVLGSCFVNHIGDRLANAGFDVLHPYGTIYNPITMIRHLKRLNQNIPYNQSDVVLSFGNYYSWHHSNVLRNENKDDLLTELNEQVAELSIKLNETDCIVISLGTSWVYEYSDFGIVGNCHKVPSKSFSKRILTINEIMNEFSPFLKEMSDKTFLFTVSPVRHWADGPVENTQSKSVLHLAIRELTNTFSNCFYFPSYEIMMDELRDHRFYAQDMLHPSDEAIDYIWNRFKIFSMNSTTQNTIEKVEKVRAGIAHKPFNPKSEQHQQFLSTLLKDIEKVNLLTPSYNWEKEKEQVTAQLM